MLGALIGAGAQLAGGLLGMKSQKDANKANEASQLRQEALQKEFAQSGIQWKVKDAEAAGIHPLYALGANTTSYQPTNVGGGATDFGFLGDAGQNIGRAIDATRSTPASAMALKLGQVQIEGAQLDNELKRTQLISAIRTAGIGTHPALPSPNDVYPLPGQGNSGIISSVPPGHEVTSPKTTAPDLAVGGRAWKRQPGWSDAQSFEDVYGDESPLAFMLNAIRSYGDVWMNTAPAYKKHITDKLRR